MKTNSTDYRIYRQICNILGIIYPFKESEITAKMKDFIYPEASFIEFHFKKKKDETLKIYRESLNKIRDSQSIIYYRILKQLGSNYIDKIITDICNKNVIPTEHHNMEINLHTFISVLYLSGYRGDVIENKLITFLQINSKER